MSDKLKKYASENLAQKVAVEDTFSIERYQQFARHLPNGTHNVLDIGCAEGRGGAKLKACRPKIDLIGLDCVKERLEALPPEYSKGIVYQVLYEYLKANHITIPYPHITIIPDPHDAYLQKILPSV